MPFEIATSTRIDAPTSRVYDLMTDLSGAPERIQGIKSLEVLTEGEFGVGTRFRETRVMFGKEATEEMEIVEVKPGESYTTTAESCGCLYRSTVSVTPEGQGSLLTMTFQGTPQSFMAKVMAAVMGPVMRKSMIKMVDKDLADIKTAAESAPA